jgi:hypothetical protein
MVPKSALPCIRLCRNLAVTSEGWPSGTSSCYIKLRCTPSGQISICKLLAGGHFYRLCGFGTARIRLDQTPLL